MSKRNRKVKVTEKEKQTRLRQESSLKSMYFNRFLMVRYLLAVFIFANFSWAVLSWGDFCASMAMALLILGIWPAFEMGKMYGVKSPNYSFTKFYFRIQLGVTAAMCVMIFTSPIEYIFPFFTDTILSRVIGFAISLTGLIMSILVVRRLGQIDKGIDKQYQRIQFFETKYRLHI